MVQTEKERKTNTLTQMRFKRGALLGPSVLLRLDLPGLHVKNEP